VLSGTLGVIVGAWLLRLWSGEKTGQATGVGISQRSIALRLGLSVAILSRSKSV
jgi:hypothetical protein